MLTYAISLSIFELYLKSKGFELIFKMSCFYSVFEKHTNYFDESKWFIGLFSKADVKSFSYFNASFSHLSNPRNFLPKLVISDSHPTCFTHFFTASALAILLFSSIGSAGNTLINCAYLHLSLLFGALPCATS